MAATELTHKMITCIYSQNDNFGLIHDMIYQFLGMEAKNYKFGIFANNVIHPWPQVMQIFDREMPPWFTPAICLRRNFVYISNLENVRETNPLTKTFKILFWIVMPTFGKSCQGPWLHGLKNQSYCKISNIRHTKSQNLNDFLLVWQLSLPNPLKPGV